MKYRIRKEIDGYTLKATYRPQYKWLGLIRFDFLEYQIIGTCKEISFSIYFDTKEKAIEFIKKERAEKCTSYSYIKV